MYKNTLLIALFLSLVIIFVGCVHSEWMPQSGLWYCDDLQLQITFSEGECFVIRDNETITCICENDIGSMWFSVLCNQNNVEELPIGTVVFCGKRVSLSENTFVVSEEHTNTVYTFVRRTGDEARPDRAD